MTNRRFPDIAALAADRPRRCWLVLYGLFFALLLAWGIGTPLQQSPDEWSHLFRAAGIYNGQLLISSPGPMDPTLGDPIRVPASLNEDRIAARCFMHHNKVPVSCSHPRPTSDALVRGSTPAARYPPFYYGLVGWPMLFGHGHLVLYLMRVVAAALSAALLAWGMLSVLRLGTGLAATGLLVAVTPMVGWLSSMINPNGLEIAAAAALWPSLLLWFTATEDRLRRAGAIGAAVAAATMVLSRSVAIVWVSVALVSVLALPRASWLRAQLRDRLTYRAVGGVVLAGVVTLAWSVLSRQNQLAPLTKPHFHIGHASLARNLVAAYGQLGRWWHEAVGYFGWLDTPISSRLLHIYDLAWVLLIAAAVIATIRTRRFRAAGCALIAGALTVAVTVYLAASVTNELSISFWQGRYSLPMGIGVPVLLGFAAPTPRGRARRTVAAMSVVISAIGCVVMVTSFLTFFARNSVGVGHPLSLRGGWQPPGGIILWLLVMSASLLGLALVAVSAALGGRVPVQAGGSSGSGTDAMAISRPR